ncbi:uncharacterized protein CLUP02_02941 [Colletotrichum lupini]|uniref:Uncharacterized protein n=1 Tax=Colletotrichum lupini TaxID=145971 RepID=A0A9Q8SHY5_9PEZI|nr:uncharacterized protein CLUP02_02941 [Colletotrichum lupini]KAK1722172.1 hypothetical protein BDP67DRAFT_16547 [Colletotrichum lupini]UQC77473.1 hypothetical protein CLUP02_02941 [Colletotrichum lupini]
MPCFCHGWCPVCTSFPGATLASAAHDACRPFGRPPLSLERPSGQFCSSSASLPPRQDATLGTQGRHPPRPNSVTAGWNSLIKCGDVVAGEEEKGPRKKESKTREKKRSDDFDFFVSLPCAEHAASTSHQQQHCPLSRLSHLSLPPSFHVF